MKAHYLTLSSDGRATLATRELDATRYADDAEAFGVLSSAGQPVEVSRERELLAKAVDELREAPTRTLEQTQALVGLERRLRRLAAPRSYTELLDPPRRGPDWEPPKPGPILA